MATPFELPGDEATDEARLAALDAMNQIKLTLDQFEQGWDVYTKAQASAFEHGLPPKTAMTALEAFCFGENLLPADIAAAAILTRMEPIFLAAGDGVHLIQQYPETYASYILGPIAPEAVGLEP
jgi:hypothetical protein